MDNQLLYAKARDAIRICRATNMYKSVGFITTNERTLLEHFTEFKNDKFVFFGGYDDAERVMFVALPQWCDSVDDLDIIRSFTFTYRKCDKLSHRDFLGTFMSLGIKRESIGDILCEDGRTVAFFADGVADYVGEQISKVGGVGVTVSTGFSGDLPGLSQLRSFTDTIASMRLDSVVAALISSSREKAKALILDKRVCVNSIVCEKITYSPDEFSKISIKGFGKFILDGASSKTKKGRIVLNYKKYTN